MRRQASFQLLVSETTESRAEPTTFDPGLAGNHQLQNAALACALAHTWLTSSHLRDRFADTVPRALELNNLSDKFKSGLANVRAVA